MSRHFHDHPHPLFRGPRGQHHDGEGRGTSGRRGRPGGAEAEGHHARRRERMFEAGGLKLIALHLIAQQPSHGYDLIRAIGELVGGDYQPSPGTIYPTLSYLVDMGHASATDVEGGRKQYAITPQGQLALQQQESALAHLLARLSHGKDRQARQRHPTLVRAIENFRTALRLKTQGQPDAPAAPLSEAQIDAIALILDEAARAIEKT